ncbi:uncharacterized protein LOC132544665 [Ylistrum balloti]|uniref:uncharacterized protein LOC132544665 n=1 Tax=Ylistrum balloti TaxID=509963 RepID=UPI002905D816|nr:uncharacterized protein LOC132544665 [Ylistrum balloti]
MQKSLVNLFFAFVCGVTVVSAFHMQNDPSQIARVCTGRISQICQSAGMRCRANQAFDADIPHAVCDRMNGRTRGIRPAALLARQGRMRQQNIGGQFGGMATNIGRTRGFGRGTAGLGVDGQAFGGRLGRAMGNGMAGGRGIRGGMGINGLDQIEFGGQEIGNGLGFGAGGRQFGGVVNGGLGRRQQFTRGLNTGLAGTGNGGVGMRGGVVNRQLTSGGVGLNGGINGLNSLNGGLNEGLNGGLNTGLNSGLIGGMSGRLGTGGTTANRQVASSFQSSGLGGQQFGGSQLGDGLNLGLSQGQGDFGGTSQTFNSGAGNNQWI